MGETAYQNVTNRSAHPLDESTNTKDKKARTAVNSNVPRLIKLRRAPHKVNDARLGRRVHWHGRTRIISEDTRSENQLPSEPQLVLLLTLEDLESEGCGVQLAEEVDLDGREVRWGYGL